MTTIDRLEAALDRLDLLTDRQTSHAHDRAWEAVQADAAEIRQLEAMFCFRAEGEQS